MSEQNQPATEQLHVFTDDHDWFVAADEDDARRAIVEWGGYDPTDVELEQLPDDKLLTINIEDEGRVTKTCGEWAREHLRGFLCSTEI